MFGVRRQTRRGQRFFLARAPRGLVVIRERTLQLPLGGSAQSHLEVIRFGAANRLCIDLDYQGVIRRIEPYSLRRTQEGSR